MRATILTSEVVARVKRPKLILAGLIAISCAVAYLAGTFSGRAVEASENLAVAAEYLNFGEVFEQKSFRWRMRVHNQSKQEAKIYQFLTSCVCSSVEPSSMVIPAGATENIELIIDLTRREPAEENLVVRDFDLSVRPRVEGREHQDRWKIHGRVRSAVTFSPRSLNFGESLVKGMPFASKNVSLLAHVPLSRVDVTCEPNVARVEVVKKTDVGKYTLNVFPNPALPSGPFKSAVAIAAVGQDGKPFPTVDLPLTGKVVEQIQAVPDTLLLGQMKVGQTIDETIVLQSISGRDFEVFSVNTDSPDIIVKSENGGKLEKTFRVNHEVRGIGFQEKSISFKVRLKEEAQRVINIHVGLSWQAVK